MVTHDLKPGGLKLHQFILSLLWSPESSRTPWSHRGQPLSPLPAPGAPAFPSGLSSRSPDLCVCSPLFYKDIAMGFGPIMASSAQELELNYLCKESCSKWGHIHSFQDRDLSLGRTTLQATADADAWIFVNEDRTWVLLHHTWLLQLENYE